MQRHTQTCRLGWRGKPGTRILLRMYEKIKSQKICKHEAVAGIFNNAQRTIFADIAWWGRGFLGGKDEGTGRCHVIMQCSCTDTRTYTRLRYSVFGFFSHTCKSRQPENLQPICHRTFLVIAMWTRKILFTAKGGCSRPIEKTNLKCWVYFLEVLPNHWLYPGFSFICISFTKWKSRVKNLNNS